MTEQVAPPSQPAGGPVPAPPVAEAAAPVKEPSKARGFVKRVIGALVVFAVVSLGGLAWKYLSGAPETAKAGDCMVGQSEDTLKTVKCDDAKVEWKVAGKVDGKTKAEFDTNADSICSAYPTYESAYWEGEEGGKGYVLCLEPVKK